MRLNRNRLDVGLDTAENLRQFDRLGIIQLEQGEREKEKYMNLMKEVKKRLVKAQLLVCALEDSHQIG